MPLIHNKKSSFSGPTLIKLDQSSSTRHESTYGEPELDLLIPPVNKMRFRYETEKGSHGVLTGYIDPSLKRQGKVYPKVQLKKYSGDKPVFLKISLYTIDEKMLHVLYLYGKDCVKKEGVCKTTFSKDLTAVFQVSIGSRKNKEVIDELKRRKEENELFGNDFEINFTNIEEVAKSINQNACKLCFEAYTEDPNRPICSLFSDVIYNSKSTETGDLKICRLSRVSGACSGGDEVFLFCDKVKKENVKVRFYEEEDGEVIWEGFGAFHKADWHHQVALVFKTPPYKENKETKVWIELQRTTDGATSQPREFLYIPNDIDPVRKRKRLDPPHEGITNFNVNKIDPLQQVMNQSQICSNLYHAASFPASPSSTEDESILNDVNFNPGISDINHFHLGDILNFQSDIAMGEVNDLEYDDLLKDLPFNDEFTFNNNPNFDGVDGAYDGAVGYAGLVSSNNVDCNVMWDGVVSDALVKKFSSLSVTSKSASHKEEAEQPYDTETLPESKMIFNKAVIDAFRNGNVKSLLRFFFHMMNPLQDSKGNSLLHLAAVHQGHNLKFLSELLELTPNFMLNHQNKRKKTPLHFATETNKHLMIKLLLLHGAMPTIQDLLGDTCVHIACKMSSAEVLKEFLSKIKNPDELSIPNYEGLTPLHISVIEGAEECVKLLSSFGADLNVQDKKSGKTPLHFAVEAPLPILKFLLSQPNIDKTAEDFYGKTILNYAEDTASTEHKSFIEAHITSCCKDNKGTNTEPSSPAEVSETVPEKINFNCYSNDKGHASFLNPSQLQKLCSLMDPPCSDWRTFGMVLGCDEETLDSILKLQPKSPTTALLATFQREYPEFQVETLKNMLKVADLNEAASTL